MSVIEEDRGQMPRHRQHDLQCVHHHDEAGPTVRLFPGAPRLSAASPRRLGMVAGKRICGGAGCAEARVEGDTDGEDDKVRDRHSRPVFI
jgi:hypothetical protein